MSISYGGQSVNDGSNQFDLARFYLPQEDGEPNLFEIWEDGGARGDSVTPSTYSAEYRTWMVDKLAAEVERNHCTGLLSLGCGNGAVEGEIVRRGYRVVGVDAMAEAVALAKAKGVEAVHADLNVWQPDEAWSLIYMDGVLGHLYDPSTGLQHILKRVRSWLTPTLGPATATFVASNDSTNNGAPVQPAVTVHGFHWLSAAYLHDQALSAGFADIATEEFRYQRPQSGERVRSIIVARLHA